MPTCDSDFPYKTKKSFRLQLALAADMNKHLSLKYFLSISTSLQVLNPNFFEVKHLRATSPMHFTLWPYVQISPPDERLSGICSCREKFQHLSGNWCLPGWKETLGCHHSRHQLSCPRDTPRETEQETDHLCTRILLQTKYKWTEKLELTKKGLFGWVSKKKNSF